MPCRSLKSRHYLSANSTLPVVAETCKQVEDKTKFWAGTYYWTGTKFRAAGSKFWSAKSRVRLAGVTENAERTCRKLSGLSGFSPRENKIFHTFFIDCINKYSKVSNAHNSDDCHGVFNGGMLNKGWSFSRSRFDCLGLMHFFHG